MKDHVDYLGSNVQKSTCAIQKFFWSKGGCNLNSTIKLFLIKILPQLLYGTPLALQTLQLKFLSFNKCFKCCNPFRGWPGFSRGNTLDFCFSLLAKIDFLTYWPYSYHVAGKLCSPMVEEDRG